MPNNVDNRVVNMQFDNAQFEKNISTTQKSLSKLDQALKFKDAGKGFDEIDKASKKLNFSSMAKSIQTISDRFSNLGIVGLTVLQNLTNSAVNAGKRIMSAFTIDPIKTGFQEYETQINAVQTILANTQSKGTGLKEVNAALDELNKYADMTIYNFTEMTRNIGTFTAAGVDLDTSVSAIKGIANLAAVSGSNSQQASTAMYQLSQALAAGTVKLQDWNSVVNAGMGGQVFQDALKETARVHGVKIDEMINKEGSFRETLQKGWLTSSILTETLAKFTGDLNEEQLRSIGYNDEQIQGIMEMGRTANDAATKVKTFTQLFDTLAEAAQSGWTQSWEIIIGDFEEAKKFLTELSDTFSEVINDSANARNEVLQGWKDLGGRDTLIDGFRNLFKAAESWIKPIKEAFSEMIPPITAQKLYDITSGFTRLTKFIMLGEESVEKVKRTFRGLFAVIDIGRQVLITIGKSFRKAFDNLEGFGGSILNTTAEIGDFLVKLDEAVKKGTLLSQIGETLDKVFAKVSTVLNKLNGLISGAFSKLGNGDFSGITNFFNKAYEKIKEAFSKIKLAIMVLVENFDFSKAVTTLLAGLSGGLLFKLIQLVSGFVKKLNETADSAKEGFADKIKDVLDNVSETLQTFIGSIKVGMLVKIAIALGILAAALYVLAGIDSKSLAKGLGALGALLGELFGSLALFSKLDPMSLRNMTSLSGLMISLGISINLLASAVKKLGSLNWRELTKGLFGVGVLCGELSLFLRTAKMDKMGLVKSIGLIALAGAINILAIAVKQFAQLDTKSLLKGLGAVFIALTELAIFTNMVGDSKGMISTGIGMIALATSMLILQKAVAAFASMSLKELGKGLGALAIAMFSLAAAMNLMPKNMISTGTGLLIVSGAINVLTIALQALSQMSLKEIAKSLGMLGGSLFIITAALKLMSGSLSGAVALGVVATTLALLIPELKLLGSMSIEEIFIALGALASTFILLGIAAVALQPLVPTLLALSAAIALFGVGIGAIGAGVLAFSAGLTALSAGGTVAVEALKAIVIGIIELIPQAATALADGLITFTKTILENAPTIVEGIVTLVQTILTSLTEVLPQVFELITMLVDGIITTVTELIPSIVELGMTLIMSLLEGISNNIFQIVVTASQIIINFINGLATQLPMLIQAGFDLMISFLNGLADGIRNNMGLVLEAVWNVITAIIESVISTLGGAVGGMLEAGGNLIQGVVDGLNDGLSWITSAIGDLINSGIDCVKNFIHDFFNAGKDLIQGLIDGIKDMIGGIGNAIGDVANAAIGGLKGLLGIASPSKVFKQLGIYTIEGFVMGIAKSTSKVSDVIQNAGSTAVDTMQETLSNIENRLVDNFSPDLTITPVLDMTNIDQGINSLYSSFDKPATISLESTTNRANSALGPREALQNQIDNLSNQGPVIYNTYDMTQNNYSPKALSQFEIFRQTKNQFSRLKGVVNS